MGKISVVPMGGAGGIQWEQIAQEELVIYKNSSEVKYDDERPEPDRSGFDFIYWSFDMTATMTAESGYESKAYLKVALGKTGTGSVYQPQISSTAGNPTASGAAKGSKLFTSADTIPSKLLYLGGTFDRVNTFSATATVTLWGGKVQLPGREA